MEAIAMSRSIYRRSSRGVTLMELLVVVTVIGILSAIAVPAYRQYSMRVARTDAKRELLSVSSKLERCFTRTTDYQIASRGSADACVELDYSTDSGTYTIEGEIEQLEFTLSAVPAGGQLDDKCGTFTLTSAGQQDVVGEDGSMTAVRCWDGRN
jgi:type IV pilus assembly protein PilE